MDNVLKHNYTKGKIPQHPVAKEWREKFEE